MFKKIADGFCCTIGVLLALAVNSMLADHFNKMTSNNDEE